MMMGFPTGESSYQQAIRGDRGVWADKFHLYSIGRRNGHLSVTLLKNSRETQERLQSVAGAPSPLATLKVQLETDRGALPQNKTMPTVNVRYFALFRERAGCDRERLITSAETVGELYAELQPRLGLEPTQVRGAVNGEFVQQDHRLTEGDEVVFVPPVAGG
ncbi:hypothetical protein BH11ARM2_BH11ARM2_37470 [soil metagenome]